MDAKDAKAMADLAIAKMIHGSDPRIPAVTRKLAGQGFVQTIGVVAQAPAPVRSPTPQQPSPRVQTRTPSTTLPGHAVLAPGLGLGADGYSGTSRTNSSKGQSMNPDNTFAKKYGILVVLLVVFTVIGINIYNVKSNNEQESRRMAYEQSPGAVAERQFELDKRQKEIERLRAQAELERAKRMEGQVVVIPPNGAVFQPQPK
jgi:hypothetical protein